MKVALLTDCYLPRLGGIEVQTHDLAAHLVARGHEVEVFTATPGEQGERHGTVEVVDGVAVHRMALNLPWELPVNPWAPPEVRRRLRRGGFDVVHLHMGVVSPFASDLARVALGLGLPTAITWHCLMARSRPVFHVLGQARRWGRRGAALSAVSGLAASQVRAVVGDGVPVEVLPNGIDVAAWSPPTAAPARDPGVVRVVSAMRFAARKRPLAVLEIVRAARAVVPAEVELKLDLYGEGPARGRLEAYAAKHQMTDWVTLPGRVTREELRAGYWRSDVYLTPARLEAFGIAALEARTAGLPVLARADTGVADFVADGVNGMLAADDRALAAALATVATDPGLRARIARENATVAPLQSWETVAALAELEYRRAGAG
ncbi:MAG TPA: glycosyltransferase [Pedococcus sp.]|nr:glycosyltransferase [Pedococcus sp.]